MQLNFSHILILLFTHFRIFALYGDFNARCGSLSDICDKSHIVRRQVVDSSAPNSHGRALVDLQRQ